MILLDPTKCQGCRICEAACGFHHTVRTAFDPSKTSTFISRDNDTAVVSMSVDSTCDLCKGEEMALCVKYCAYGARGIRR